MATVVLSAVGAMAGGAIGGTFAGLSSVAVGRLVGATLGKSIDQRIMGQGADVIESGRVDRFRITGAAEGEAVNALYGAMRIGGQVIWASQFQENVETTGGGKGLGGNTQPKTNEFSYSISVAIALCAGEITRVGRVWADGQEIAPSDLNMRVYTGSKDQLPDPKIEAIEGAGLVPAYRGTAYVVMEDLQLAQFGNRLPQFSFEVARPMPSELEGAASDVTHGVQGIALVPGTGEYALATTPVYYQHGPGQSTAANLNSPSGKSDFETSFERLTDELPNCGSVSMVVSWFGNDLRCGSCDIRPKVENAEFDGDMAWNVAGETRSSAAVVPKLDNRAVYGGTPTDASVIEAIKLMHEQGKEVMFYPFILMDQLDGNGLDDPWSDAYHQPKLPWRGRITLSEAPGRVGSPDGTAVAASEVAGFFGTASAGDFVVSEGTVSYSGPAEWKYRRFILHYAALCKAAGGVASFCIGSEMRGLTQIRGMANQFVAVQEMISLLAEVRAILGSETKIGYAADWSEYFGYHPQDGSNDVYFHLDALWSDPELDFVGIDNYMPLSDWRDGEDHADAEWRSIYNLEYLKGNVAGGEGYDWYYHSSDAEEAQIRTDITDGTHNEPWVFRYKDIRNWWSNAHHHRVSGTRDALPTDWIPQSKPIWFTELGCAAIDKGTNEPNKFLDPKSSESDIPKYSNGQRDEFIQRQYLTAMYEFWGEAENNPVSVEYAAPMVDMSKAHVWAWDARPYPHFPNNRSLWSDGGNYARGHWLNGRASSRTLSSVVAEVCENAGVISYDVSELYGVVRGYVVPEVTNARSVLQPLMLRFGFDAVERDGTLAFAMRDGRYAIPLDPETLVVSGEFDGVEERSRASEADMAGRVRVNFISAEGDFEAVSEEAVLADEATHAVSSNDIPLSLTRAEARQTAERWLTEARVAREGLRIALPPSKLAIGAGDIVSLPGQGAGQDGLYRVDRVTQGAMQMLDAVRIEPEVYVPSEFEDESGSLKAFVPPTPVLPLFMDLPLLSGDEVPHAPHVAVTAKPWPGTVAVYDSASDANYSLNQIISRRAVIGTTQNVLPAAKSGLIDNGESLQVQLITGQLESVTWDAVLSGSNLAAIGDGTAGNWEVFQFQDAELIAPDTYLLTKRLRGQTGTDALMPSDWPVGSYFVLLNSAPSQIELASSNRNVARHYRIGSARRGYDDPSYSHLIEAFAGNGLRPYSPAHLIAKVQANDDLNVSWIRRTRIDGDSWELSDVPVGEESEAYVVRVFVAGALVREESVNDPAWSYPLASRVDDGIVGSLATIAVAQVSARFGNGVFSEIELTA